MRKDGKPKMLDRSLFNRYVLLACLLAWLVGCCGTVPSTITQTPAVQSKSASKAALHVIGVHQGPSGRSVGQRGTWAQCHALRNAAEHGQLVSPDACLADVHQAYDPRTITVNVSDNSQPIILGLMAYEAVNWQITTAPGVVIERVIVAGYHQPLVQGVGDVQIDVYSYDNSPCPRCVQKGRFFYAYERVPLEIELAAGVRASSFQGNYIGGSYQIFKGMQ